MASIWKGELIEFLTKDGVILHGFLMNRKNADTCIIYVHGMGGNFHDSNLPFAFAGKLKKRNTAVFTINTRGHDSVSFPDRKKGRKIESFLAGTDFERFEDCILDISGAISALKGMGFRKFILAGHSTGCQKVVYYQYKNADKSVRGIILLAAGDDYNITRKQYGRKFSSTVARCRVLLKKGKGSAVMPRSHFSARRLLSVSDLKYVEARLFNYDGKLSEFARITVPILAIFGSSEQYAVKPVATYLAILKSKTGSKNYSSRIIIGARHSFRSHEKEVAAAISEWLG